MQEREAKLLCKSHDLVSISVSNKSSGWVIQITEKNKNVPDYLISKRSTDPRLFKTSDAALRCCHRIGFNKVEVTIN